MKDTITIGMDLGDRIHFIVVLDEQGNELEANKVGNTKTAIRKYFDRFKTATVVLEAGTHSPWISRELEQMGFTVYVGNPRKLRFIWDSTDKSDERDARMLAMVGRLEPKLLWPVHHRDKQSHADLTVIKSREVLVKSRTQLINHARGVVKSTGERLPTCSSASFARRCREYVPCALWPALSGVFEIICQLTEQIRHLDREIDRLCRERYPETHHLQQVPGVGPVTSLAYVLSLEEPGRFAKSRQVGPYLGLTPRRDQSGQTDRQLRISKAGNKYLRQLLVSCSHYILGPFAPDSNLRRHGLAIAARGGKNARKRAVVAVARKLSVLLHRLWADGQEYQPFYGKRIQIAA